LKILNAHILSYINSSKNVKIFPYLVKILSICGYLFLNNSQISKIVWEEIVITRWIKNVVKILTSKDHKKWMQLSSKYLFFVIRRKTNEEFFKIFLNLWYKKKFLRTSNYKIICKLSRLLFILRNIVKNFNDHKTDCNHFYIFWSINKKYLIIFNIYIEWSFFK